MPVVVAGARLMGPVKDKPLAPLVVVPISTKKPRDPRLPWKKKGKKAA